jgi:putative phosphoribosyl transferase
MRAFANRQEAGQELAERLREYADRPDVVVLGLPRGGVPVAHEVARALNAPLDVIIVRKLGLPGHPELAMGAIAGGKVGVVNRQLMRAMRVQDAQFDRVLEAERAELARREREYRGTRPPLDLKGRTVILVDDGLATGATMAAAVSAVAQQHPARIVVAVPVASREAVAALTRAGADVVTVMTPEPFYGVGYWYQEFDPTSDAEVKALLAAGPRDPTNPTTPDDTINARRRPARASSRSSSA